MENKEKDIVVFDLAKTSEKINRLALENASLLKRYIDLGTMLVDETDLGDTMSKEDKATYYKKKEDIRTIAIAVGTFMSLVPLMLSLLNMVKTIPECEDMEQAKTVLHLLRESGGMIADKVINCGFATLEGESAKNNLGENVIKFLDLGASTKH